MAELKLFYRLIVKDKRGRVVKRTRLRQSKSFVLQFLQFLEIHARQTTVSILDFTNTPRSRGTGVTNLNMLGPDNDATQGIVVGTGTTAPTNTDIVMQAKIAHGAGAGQLNYEPMGYDAAAVVGSNVDFVFRRTFVNQSGATINVTEIGIYSIVATFTFLLVHDVVSAVAVANGQTLTVEYTFRTTV